MIGDSDKDILAGEKAGLKTILVDSPKRKEYRINVKPNFKTTNINSAIDLILKNRELN